MESGSRRIEIIKTDGGGLGLRGRHMDTGSDIKGYGFLAALFPCFFRNIDSGPGKRYSDRYSKSKRGKLVAAYPIQEGVFVSSVHLLLARPRLGSGPDVTERIP